MKKRFLIVCGLCAIAVVVALLLRPRHAARIVPSPEVLARMFPDDSRQVFKNADLMTLYRITDDIDLPQKNLGKFRDFYIVSKAKITDRKTRAALIAHLYEGVKIGEQARLQAQSQSQLKQIDSGFDPQYAVRAVKGKRKVDVLTDFSRIKIRTYYGDQSGKANTTTAPQNFYDAVLQNAGVLSNG